MVWSKGGGAAGDLSNTLQWQKACALIILQYCMKVLEVGFRHLILLGVGESELRGSSTQQGDPQAHLVHELVVSRE